MPIYTDDPGTGINQPLSNVESGLGESLSASFTQGFREGPLMSGIRFAQADQYANDPNSPVVSKTEADAKLKELGVKSINIPDSGVTQSFMDHVTQERKEALARQQIASSAPSGFINTPLNFMVGLAGSMADPANLAIGLVPFAGEARAATALGRFGERFVQGSIYGGVQTAVAIPFTALAAAAEGDNFTLAQGMENIFLGMVGGESFMRAEELLQIWLEEGEVLNHQHQSQMRPALRERQNHHRRLFPMKQTLLTLIPTYIAVPMMMSLLLTRLN